MNKWSKFENTINLLLTRMWGMITRFIMGLIPKKFIDFVLRTQQLLSSLSQRIVSYPILLKNNSKRWILEKFTLVLNFVQVSKVKLLSFIASLREIKFNAAMPAVFFKTIYAKLTDTLIERAKKFSPMQYFIFSVSFLALSLTSISVYKNVQEMSEKMNPEGREIASVDQEEVNKWKRSQFRNKDKHIIFLRYLDVPIYIQARNGMSSLRIDVSLEASNRYTASFFYEADSEIMVRDRLNASLQAVVPNFPLEPEGKKIIKEKIKLEMNKLIKELKIDGRIEKVYIHSILNG